MKAHTIVQIITASWLLVLLGSHFGYSYDRTEILDDDGTVYSIESHDDGSLWIWAYSPDGTIYGNELTNSDPDGGNGGTRPTGDDIKDLARRHYQGKLSKGVQTNNPFAIKQSAQGNGLAPRWNPPGQVLNGGDSGAGGSGPGSNGGGTSEWLKSMARKGGQNDDDGDSGNGSKADRPGLGTNGSIQPQRINPVPILNHSLTASATRPQMTNHTTVSLNTGKTEPVAGNAPAGALSLTKKSSLKNKRPVSPSKKAADSSPTNVQQGGRQNFTNTTLKKTADTVSAAKPKYHVQTARR